VCGFGWVREEGGGVFANNSKILYKHMGIRCGCGAAAVCCSLGKGSQLYGRDYRDLIRQRQDNNMRMCVSILCIMVRLRDG